MSYSQTRSHSHIINDWNRFIRFMPMGKIRLRCDNRTVKVNYLGNINILEDSPKTLIAGSRRASFSGRLAAVDIAENEIKQSNIIITGGAIGIDFEVIKMTVVYLGRQIIVFPVPITRPTPQGNICMFKHALEHNALILSQFDDWVQTEKYHFVQRNELMVQLADKVIIVEARPNSGSLWTLKFGLKYGKPVYVLDVPKNRFMFNEFPVEKYELT
ncbi:DNA-processing protein DprA [Candidatus Micrarchaeota archaeon]|nr:DNA-processing protein DprA [Candidatus Micrarchaeota archaeon]